MGSFSVRMRKGAVVSLHSVLGDCGVLKAQTEIIFAVFPAPFAIDARTLYSSFHSMPRRVFEAGLEKDRLDASGSYPRATPERAWVDYLWLWGQGRMSMPPTESDIEDLDWRRVMRLARVVGVRRQLDEWVQQWRCFQSSDKWHYGTNL